MERRNADAGGAGGTAHSGDPGGLSSAARRQVQGGGKPHWNVASRGAHPGDVCESFERREPARDAIIVSQVEARPRANLRSVPQKRELRLLSFAGTSGRKWALLSRAIPLTLLVMLAAAGAKAQPAVDLQLVLAVDASGSVDQVRFDLQKQGYVAAFRHARVLQAIRSGP